MPSLILSFYCLIYSTKSLKPKDIKFTKNIMSKRKAVTSEVWVEK